MIPLSNVEAQWAKLTSEEKTTVHEQLEVLQQKDWKELSIDEKKLVRISVLRGVWTARA
jgi:cytochrome c oxidase subunit 4